MISGQQAFFSSNLVGRIFFSLLNALQNIFFLFISLQDFFFLKKVSCVYIYRMYLHLHCGGDLFFLVVFNLGVLDA